MKPAKTTPRFAGTVKARALMLGGLAVVEVGRNARRAGVTVERAGHRLMRAGFRIELG